MTAVGNPTATPTDLPAVSRWLEAFEAAMSTCDLAALRGLIAEDAMWRDLGSLTWNLRQAHDRDQILAILGAVLAEGEPHTFAIAPDRPAPGPAPYEPNRVEVFFTFQTRVANARARATLEADASTGELVLKVLLSQLTSLRDRNPVWPQTDRFDVTHPEVRWHQHKEAQTSYSDRDPQVLIVGGGHSGVMTAAHLSRLGVDALVIDKQPKVGDAWRSRYESLLLHQPHGMLYFPFMKYPESYPEYIPKDKFAEWFEGYVAALDLNFWTSTELVSARFDEALGRWDAHVAVAGEVRVMHPAHIVLATGGSTQQRVPTFPGLDDYSGEKLFAKDFSSGADFSGKRVLIIGVGVTAHDYAEDIVKHGGHATMLQRSPQIVVDLDTACTLYGDYNARVVPTEWIDERFMSGMIYPLLRAACQMNQAAGEEQDKELLDGLREAGMKLWSGDDGTGWFFNFFKTYGGYYINVGASNMIIDGQIGLMQTDDVDRFTATGALMNSGEEAQFDAIIYATGYESPTVEIERMFGREVADKLGPVWGMGPDGELNNISKPTAQQGLWIMMGGIPTGRYFAPPMAVMIQAQIEGLFPESFQTPGHPSQTPSRGSA